MENQRRNLPTNKRLRAFLENSKYFAKFGTYINCFFGLVDLYNTGHIMDIFMQPYGIGLDVESTSSHTPIYIYILHRPTSHRHPGDIS